MAYNKPHHYARQELIDGWKEDMLAEIEFAQNQAKNGPHFPERGITKESLLKYVAECRANCENPEQSLKELNIGFY